MRASLFLMLAMQCTGTVAATLRVDLAGADDIRNNRFVSIGQALLKLKSGDTLTIADGVYRETIDLRQANLRNDSGSAPLTRIEAASGAHPIIKGSDVVKGWRLVADNVYAKEAWTSNSQQVFIDGAPLKQIGGTIFGGYPTDEKHKFALLHRSQGGIWPGRTGQGVADLVAESFYYDAEAKILYVKTAADITQGRTVEVSTRPYLVIGTGVDHVDIRGLRFEHASTTAVSQSGAITLIGNHLVLDDVTVEYVDGAGIDITGNDNVVGRSTANHCGIVGMKVRGRNARVVDNETSFNNTRAFNKWWEAGGAKFVGDGGLQDSEVSGHRAYANNGDGLWFDWHNANNRIHGNVAAYNAGMGIHYEAGTKAYIYDNYLIGNAQRGIYLPNSSHSVVAHNLVAANAMEGIAIVDERHADQTGQADLVPGNNNVIANILAWNGKAALVLPTTGDNRSDGNVYVGDEAPRLSMGWPTREHPLVPLDAWQTQSQQDGNSRWNRKSTPPEIAEQLERRQPLSPTTRRAWDPILKAADDVHLPALAGIEPEFSRPGTAPGPFR
jgi:hypothetical protein